MPWAALNSLKHGVAVGLSALWTGLAGVVLATTGILFYQHSLRVNNMAVFGVVVGLVMVVVVAVWRDLRHTKLAWPVSLVLAIAILPVWPLYALGQTTAALVRHFRRPSREPGQGSGTTDKRRHGNRSRPTDNHFSSTASLLPTIIAALLLLAVVVPTWISGYGLVTTLALDHANLAREPVNIAGTGSMYPTFPKSDAGDEQAQAEEVVTSPLMWRYPSGFELFGRPLFTTSIDRGDIVSFSNDRTKEVTREELGNEQGFVKRVVAVAGDVIEIRDGLLHLNGQPLLEPYTARARSTFGGQQVAECQRHTVPDDKLFVLGDNRKVSNDSRGKIGLVDVRDIDHVIPWEMQPGWLDENWRDTSQDLSESAVIQLNINRYVAALNDYRQAAGLAPLQADPQLATAARLRGQVILNTDDVSFEATASGYTIRDAIADAGYHNIVLGESIVQGYFEHDELIENQLEQPNTQTFLFSDEFDDIGLATVQGELNGCPTQVIVQHFAGFKPPNYSAEEIESWRLLLTNLRQIQPSWQELKDVPRLYDEHRDDIDKINELIAARVRIAETILSTLEANEWLTTAEQDLIEQNTRLGEEQQELARRLNNL